MPGTTTETLREIWEEVLRIEVHADTDFFDTSGDSLLAMQIYAKVNEFLGVSLPLALLFDNSRFEDFLAAVANEVRGDV